MRILIMGKDGSGKTTFSKPLAKAINAVHLNADSLRELVQDNNFTNEGRINQAKRMRLLADFEQQAQGKNVICDFICPTEETRAIFDADFVIWMDTVKTSKYENTQSLFTAPKKVDRIFNRYPGDDDITDLTITLKKL